MVEDNDIVFELAGNIGKSRQPYDCLLLTSLFAYSLSHTAISLFASYKLFTYLLPYTYRTGVLLSHMEIWLHCLFHHQYKWSITLQPLLIWSWLMLLLYPDRSVDYMAFGLSGSESTYSMIGADVVVADWMDGQQPRAIDYHLTSYAQVLWIKYVRF